MLNNLQILKEARELGSTKTLADVNAILATYDYPTLRQAERANFRIELWDKVTPINGVAPEVILQDVPEGGEVYLIYINDNLVYLQKHDPEQIGFIPMNATRATEVANKIVDDLVEQAIDAKVHDEVLVKLLS